MKKHNLKKILSAIVVTVMVSNIIPIVESKAYAVESNATNKVTETYINPVHKNMNVDVDSYSLVGRGASDAVTFNSIEEASNYVRQQMVKRSEVITFSVNSAYYAGMAKDIFDNAIKYSDEFNSNEGDYLEDHFSGYSCSLSYISTTVNFTYNMKYLTTYDQELQVNTEEKKVLDSLNVYNEDEYTKIKAVHDYIVKNTKYDYTYSKYSAYNALIEHDVVCQGFSSLTYRMLKDLGVGVRCITGNNSEHEWNIARIRGLWYNLDNTWDENVSLNNEISYKYFLKNMTDFTEHTRDADYSTSSFTAQYPMDQLSYVYVKGSVVEPSQPTNLTFSDVQYNSLTLNWNASTNTTEYEVYRLSPNDSDYVKIATTSNTIYIDKDLSENTKYSYKICAVNDSAKTFSDVVSTTTLANSKVTGITLNITSKTVVPNEETYLVAEVVPQNAINKNVTWSSSDESVAIVDQNGKVTSLKEGTAIITATSQDTDVKATCLITVNNEIIKVTGITLNKTTLNLYKDETSTLVAEVMPQNASNKNVTWSSSDNTVAKVDGSGKVTALKEGTATITATSNDSGYKATCLVTVSNLTLDVTDITLNKVSLNLNKGDVSALSAVVSPSNATNKNVTWTSSNEKVATVKDGVVTAVGVGTATITAKAGEKTSTCTVTVNEKVVLNGWIKNNNDWYYYINGAIQKGWKNINGSWYYLDSLGKMKTGWLQQGSTWYYLKPWGAMASGWQQIDGSWYYLNSWGSMATGWLQQGSTWYYLKPWGAMTSGWQQIDGSWYYLNSWGSMATGWLQQGSTWYYLKSSGTMTSGWQYVNGAWYYFYDGGNMATNVNIAGWNIGSNGVARK